MASFAADAVAAAVGSDASALNAAAVVTAGEIKARMSMVEIST